MLHLRHIRRAAIATVALLLLGAGAGCTSATSPASTAERSTTTLEGSAGARRDAAATPTPPAVVKDILGTVDDPPGAPGRTLTLIRYTIPAGAKLAPHIHPGVQLASIRSGRLTYTVVSGTAIVRRAGATTDEKVIGPATTVLGPGDAVTELDGMVHFGANDTRKPIVIDATLITVTGDDLAVPVTTTTTTPGG